MEVGADQLFSSPTDVSNFMPYELLWSSPQNQDRLWVFWSRQNNELQSILCSLYSSVDISNSENGTVAEKVKAVLQDQTYYYSDNIIIQFWAPIRIGDRIYLTTADQPFALTKFHKGLCSYRRLCVSKILISVNVSEMDDEEEYNLLGPLARVFRDGVGEFCSNVSNYYSKEYPHRDYVVEHGVKKYCVVPIFEKVGQQCVGVLEVLATSDDDFEFESVINSVHYILEWRHLKSSIPSAFRYDFKESEGTKKAHKVMEDICGSHELPFAQLWAASTTARCIERLCCYRKYTPVYRKVALYGKWERKGVVGKSFSSRSACFCNNISKLSINECPMVLDIRNLGLARCFAVCLQSTQAEDVFYILEFFLSHSDGDPRNFVCMLVATLKEKIQSYMGAHVKKLGEKLFVEVIKTSSDDELDCFEICDTAHIRYTLGSYVTRAERNDFGNYSELQLSSPFSVEEFGLGPRIGVRSYSMVESNSPSSVQEMTLDNIVVQPNPPSSSQEMRPQPEDDTISSSSVRNYSAAQRRSSTPGTSQFISNTDSDFTDINAVLQIFRRAKRRRGMLAFDMSNG